MAQALEEAQIDEDVGEGVEVGDGASVADVRVLNAESDGLGVDALDGGALVVDALVEVAVTVEGVTQASADAGRHLCSAAVFSEAGMVDRTGG